MGFVVAGILLDACVLGALFEAPAYGYELTVKTKERLGLSESALYPVLRRLQKNGLLVSYDEPFDGRNRRYYKLTDKGKQALREYELQWEQYKQNIDCFVNKPKTEENHE
jgi:PadR family transcriptional regulator PadR